MDKLARGTQIAYVPTHIRDKNGYFNSKSSFIQFGFVTSGPTADECYFCRYWIGGTHFNELRTVSNSERTPIDCIEVVASHDQALVDEMLEKYC